MVLPLRLTLIGIALIGCTANKPTHESEPPHDSAAVVEAEPQIGPTAGEPASYDQRVEIDGVTLGLSSADCVLVAEAEGAQRLVHRFEFPAACQFASDESGAVRVVQTETGKAVMVESSRPLAQDCETTTRVVVLTEQGPRVSRAQQRVAMCLPFVWDEMMFHVLGSEPVAFGTPSVEP